MCKQREFHFSVFYLNAFFFFPYLISLAESSNTMLIKSDQIGAGRGSPSTREKPLSVSLLSIKVFQVLLQMAFTMLTCILSNLYCFEFLSCMF